MKKRFITSLTLFLFSVGAVFAQVPADQDTILIPGGIDNAGLLEQTINADTVAGGSRINPNRVYKLEKDQFYYQVSSILFGNPNDTTATLNIVGEKGGKKPIILLQPAEGTLVPTSNIYGNLTIKNVYYNLLDVYGAGIGGWFDYYMIPQRTTLTLEDAVFDGGHGALFSKTINGSVFIKNSYFRDAGAPWIPWATQCVWGPEGIGMDTLWIENSTFTNTGLALTSRAVMFKFVYVNHNTFINESKQWLQSTEFEEAYWANNLFINCSYQGEDINFMINQHPDGKTTEGGVQMGVINVDTVSAEFWQTAHGYVPAMDEIKIMASDNVHWTNPLLLNYFNGAYNSTHDYALSLVTTDIDSTGDPTQVYPPIFMNDVTTGLIDAYDNIVSVNNYDNTTDPGLNTPSLDQAGADEMAKYARQQYLVGSEVPVFSWNFGDFNGATVPGVELEVGTAENFGITKISDLIEDFSYSSGLTSSIDGRPLGALHWWDGEMDTWDSEAALQEVKDAYSALVSVEKLQGMAPAKYELEQNYPNPFNPSTEIKFSIPNSGATTLKVFNMLGQEVATLLDAELSAGSYKYNFDASTLSSGIYFYTLEAGKYSETKKMVLLK